MKTSSAAPCVRCAVQAPRRTHVIHQRHAVTAAAERNGQQAGQPAAPPAAPQHAPLLLRLRSAAAAVALSATLALAPVGVGSVPEAQAASVGINNDTPVIDLARVVPSARLEGLQQQLKQLESDTGWRVRMLTRPGPSNEPSVEEIRAGWTVDDRTIVVFVDPTSPNILNFKFGREVRSVLRPQFFTELQGRFGNMFNVREQGESAAVMGMMDALTGCLAQGGCFAVPGVSMDHYVLTLATSLAGGIIAGSASKLQPTGFVQRQWVWVLLFAPLWGTLFINFGLGPIVSRTSDLLPVLGNSAAFLASAFLVASSGKVAQMAGLSTDEGDA
ncbi:methanol dehydrogenase [Micractinium conductrix]|uniref:Methanol dehydrogenase n=1 Tax=Micractinium conductrix TaxID=554055 RepID=A0A2P6V4G9_9CHLO|nr:methanol dehydrogenase [Micractinium conductrix]|eukprot:PSC68992.1 methanol dehydrogenase [Micractinium conductrix]